MTYFYAVFVYDKETGAYRLDSKWLEDWAAQAQATRLESSTQIIKYEVYPR